MTETQKRFLTYYLGECDHEGYEENPEGFFCKKCSAKVYVDTYGHVKMTYDIYKTLLDLLKAFGDYDTLKICEITSDIAEQFEKMEDRIKELEK